MKVNKNVFGSKLLHHNSSSTARTHLQKGELLGYLQNNIDDAIKHFKMAHEIDPNDHYINYRIGVFYGYGLGCFKQGIEYILQAIHCEGYFIGYLVDLGLMYYKLKHFESAIEMHDRYLNEVKNSDTQSSLDNAKNNCLKLVLLREGFTGGSLNKALLKFHDVIDKKWFEETDPDGSLIHDYVSSLLGELENPDEDITDEEIADEDITDDTPENDYFNYTDYATMVDNVDTLLGIPLYGSR